MADLALGMQARVTQKTADSEEEAPSFLLRLYRLPHAQSLKKQARQHTWLSIVDIMIDNICGCRVSVTFEASDVPVPSDGRSSDDGHEAAATEARNTHRMSCFLNRRAGVFDDLHICIKVISVPGALFCLTGCVML